jgi:hypothetical protein
MKTYLLLFILLKVSYSSAQCGWTNSKYNNYESISHSGINEYLELKFKEKFTSNVSYFGSIEFIFKCDSNTNISYFKQLTFVDPSIDSFLVLLVYNLPPELKTTLKKDTLYGTRINIENKKFDEIYSAMRILYADGKKEKALKYANLCYEKAPNNSEVEFYFVKVLLLNEDPTGKNYIIKSAERGDVYALEYLINELK